MGRAPAFIQETAENFFDRMHAWKTGGAAEKEDLFNEWGCGWNLVSTFLNCNIAFTS